MPLLTVLSPVDKELMALVLVPTAVDNEYS
jgi:hypothetical protein